MTDQYKNDVDRINRLIVSLKSDLAKREQNKQQGKPTNIVDGEIRGQLTSLDREIEIFATSLKNQESTLLSKEIEKRRNQIQDFKNIKVQLKESFDKNINESKINAVQRQQNNIINDPTFQNMKNQDLYANQKQLQELQDRELDRVNEQAVALRYQGQNINTTLDRQNKQLDRLNVEMDQTNKEMMKTNNKIIELLAINNNNYRNCAFCLFDYFFMKFIAKTLLIVLIVNQVIAVEIDPLKIANDKYNELQKQHSGKFLMDLAQLHSYLSGPLDDLKETINKFYENISDGIKQLDADYSQKTAIHEKTLQNIELNIQNAQIDIAQSQDLVDNSLISNKDITERKLKQIKINIEENRKNVERDRLQRQQQSNQNIDHIHEHALATNSIDEALQLTAGLMNGQISFSEAPMKKTINFIKNRIDEKDEYAPIIEALVSIAGSQDAKAIRDLLNKLRKNIVDSQIQLTSNENDAQKMYEDRQKQLDSEFREFQTQVNQATYDVASISSRIDQEKQFIEARKNDLSMYLDQQNMENSAYADITGLYNEFRSQKLKEAKILEDAKNFAYSAQFRELLQSKINSQ